MIEGTFPRSRARFAAFAAFALAGWVGFDLHEIADFVHVAQGLRPSHRTLRAEQVIQLWPRVMVFFGEDVPLGGSASGKDMAERLCIANANSKGKENEARSRTWYASEDSTLRD